MVRLVREIQDLCEAVLHVEHPDHDAQDAQYALFPGKPQSFKNGHRSSSPEAADLFGRRGRVNLSEAPAQSPPTRGALPLTDRERLQKGFSVVHSDPCTASTDGNRGQNCK